MLRPAWLTCALACAALALYLLDVTFRLAQQAFPVRLHVASVDPTGQLAQLHMAVDAMSPMRPLQVCLPDKCVSELLRSKIDTMHIFSSLILGLALV